MGTYPHLLTETPLNLYLIVTSPEAIKRTLVADHSCQPSAPEFATTDPFLINTHFYELDCSLLQTKGEYS